MDRAEHIFSRVEATQLSDHAFRGLAVMPGTGYLHALVAALGPRAATLTDVEFEQVLLIDPDAPAVVHIDSDNARFSCFSDGQTHVRGALAPGQAMASLPDATIETGTLLGADDIYGHFGKHGNEYGPAFRRIVSFETGKDTARARIDATIENAGIRRIATLDAAVQVLAMLANVPATFVLKRISGAYLDEIAAGQVTCTARITTRDDDAVTGSVTVSDPGGKRLAQLDGITLQFLDSPDVNASAIPVVVNATFTADPVKTTLEFWGKQLGMPIAATVAPYNQVFQQLLDPSSDAANNDAGLNAFLIKPDDWVRHRRQLKALGDTALALSDLDSYRLPNGLDVAQLNDYETAYVYKEIFGDHVYKRHGISLPDEAVVFDVGANIGLFALFVEEQSENATIYSVEPAPAAYRCLQANTELYCTNGVPLNCGLTDADGEMTFTFYPNSSVFSTYQADAGHDAASVRAVIVNMLSQSGAVDEADLDRVADELLDGRLEAEEIVCPMRSLSSLIREHDIARIDLLKIDAEKAELDVLNGIDAEHWPLIDQLIIEVHDLSGKRIGDVTDRLHRYGFETIVEEEPLLTGSGLYSVYARRPGATRPDSSTDSTQVTTEQADALVNAMRSFLERNHAPVVLMLCPPAPGSEHCDISGMMRDAFAGEPEVHVIDAPVIAEAYPVAQWYDETGDRLGHMPYTPDQFTAIGTALARKLHAIVAPPKKVIALDCDNTLWGGVCGEAGSEGVELSAGHRALQRFMIEQQRRGTLLALVSKNNPEDVAAVFSGRDDMLLSNEHVSAKRVNWQAKSTNLYELADELNLGVDSFVLVDDNPVECAEVQANCPEVTTLRLPGNPDEFEAFLQHAWIFDKTAITAEDRQRTRLYRENIARERSRQDTQTLADFIDSLELDVRFSPVDDAALARAAQLTQRTNQFNMTTIRRREQELRSFLAQDACAGFTVGVRDRFGDHGIVGLVLYSAENGVLDIDTLLLSCRVLGRGVEHRMLAELGKRATASACPTLALNFVPSQKNAPALEFLTSIAGGNNKTAPGNQSVRIDAARAAALRFEPALTSTRDGKANGTGRTTQRRAVSGGDAFQHIADTLRSADAISAAIEKSRRGARDPAWGEYQAPTSDLERVIASVFERIIGVAPVGRNDQFFDIGGSSLAAVQAVSELRKALGREISSVVLYEHTTVSALAGVLEGNVDTAGTKAAAHARGQRRRQRRGGRTRSR